MPGLLLQNTKKVKAQPVRALAWEEIDEPT